MPKFLKKKKMEQHKLAGNPIVPSVWRKKIKKANCACPSLDLKFPRDSAKFKNLKNQVFQYNQINVLYLFHDMVYKVLAPAQRVQSSHSGVTEIVRFLANCSSPLVAVGYLLHELKCSLSLIFSTILYFSQTKYFSSYSSR